MLKPERARVFKTKTFAKGAKKAGIDDQALCDAIREVMAGQADDLGGGIFKKRLNDNRHRSIVVAKGGRSWVYEYLFAKKDRDNIDDSELEAFRALAKTYVTLSVEQVEKLKALGQFVEICHEDTA